MIGVIGRHRRNLVPMRLVLAATLYVSALASFSAYATVVMAS